MSLELIYWDSDAFLGWLQSEPEKMKLCQGTIELAESGDAIIITSALTLAEVLWLRGGPKIPKEKAEILGRFFRKSFIRVRPVTRSIAEAAQHVVWNNGIRPKDAIHVATALDAKSPTLETFDEGLLGKSGTVGTPALIIRKPMPPRSPRML
jgi:predicted nucleic acid-binding protein